MFFIHLAPLGFWTSALSVSQSTNFIGLNAAGVAEASGVNSPPYIFWAIVSTRLRTKDCIETQFSECRTRSFRHSDMWHLPFHLTMPSSCSYQSKSSCPKQNVVWTNQDALDDINVFTEALVWFFGKLADDTTQKGSCKVWADFIFNGTS